MTFALRSKDHNKREMLENSVPFWQQYKSMTRNWNATTIAYCRCHDHMGWWKAYYKETPAEIGTILLAVGKCCVTKLGPLFALAQLWYLFGDSNVFDNLCNLDINFRDVGCNGGPSTVCRLKRKPGLVLHMSLENTRIGQFEIHNPMPCHCNHDIAKRTVDNWRWWDRFLPMIFFKPTGQT